MRARLLSLAIVAMAGCIAHLSQLWADAARFGGGVHRDTLYLPSPEAVRVVSLGQQTLVGDLLWIDVVLRFMDVFEGRQPDGVRWLATLLDTVATLDPEWRTVYFYGGGMLRVIGDIEGSNRLYRLGMEQLPLDPFFPFSLGMNAFLYAGDPEAAHDYLDAAASLPGAPAWYGAAAASFLSHQHERRAALRYLKEELDEETRPQVRQALDRKYRELLHDEIADSIQAEVERRREAGAPVSADLRELEGLPADPLDGRWILAPDEKVRSSVRDEREAARAVSMERAMLLRPGGPTR